nr:hypothetical protein [Tanacetum cinerariifolium]
MVYCIARSNVANNYLKQKEGAIYSIKNFTVKPNKEEYRILKNVTIMLEFDGSTTIRKVFVKAEGFVRYSFELVDFDIIEPTNKKYLIDVAGYVTNVGKTTHLKSGSRNLDFHLTNHTLLIVYAVNPLISQISSAMIFDDAEIPTLKTLSLYENSGVNSKNPSLHVDLSQPKKGTLENLLMWARNRKNDSATFHCQVMIESVRIGNSWNFASYRLELDESDDTRHTVVVFFDEPATTLVKCSTESIDGADD